MLKAAGALLVLAAATGLGAALVREKKRALALTESWVSALERMALEIRETHVPLPGMLEKLAGEGPGPLREFFRELLAELNRTRWEELDRPWREGLGALRPALLPEALALLEGLGDCLGKYEAEKQAGALRLAASRLEALGQEQRRELASSGRVILAVGASVGVMAVILLL